MCIVEKSSKGVGNDRWKPRWDQRPSLNQTGLISFSHIIPGKNIAKAGGVIDAGKEARFAQDKPH